MAEEKKILFGVEVDMTKAVQQIAELNTKIAELRQSQLGLQEQMKDVAKEFGTSSSQYQNLAQQLAVNTETQKAYKKEINEVSRSLQNTIISETKYKDTLKGMAAQLSVEKDKLREIKIAGGVLTDEYIRQQQVVSDLNAKVSMLEQAYGVYTRNVGNYKSGVQELNQQLREHLQRLATLEQGSKEWKQVSERVQNLTEEIDMLNKQQTKANKGLQGIVSGVKTYWTGVLMGVTALVGAFRNFMRMMQEHREFEQAQKNLQTIIGYTNEEMEDMISNAKNLGRTTEYTARQVTELQTALAKLGFTGEQIRSMSASVLALATDLDAGLGEAADLTGSIMRSFGATALDTAHIVDVLVKGANSSALSFDKYRTAMAQVAPVANTMGFSLEDTVAILGSLVNVGMDASMAATSTRNILLKLADTNSALAKSLSQPVRDIPSLVAGLKELQARGTDVAEALALTDKRSVAAFTSLMKNADAVRTLRDELADVDGYAIGIREERLQTTEGAIKMLTSAWEGFKLSVMGSEGGLARVINNLAEDINILTDRLDPEGKARREFDELVQTYLTDYKAIANVAKEKGVDIGKTLADMYDTEIDSMQKRANDLQLVIDTMQKEIDESDSKREQKRLTASKAAAAAEQAEIARRYRALKQAYEQLQEGMGNNPLAGGSDDNAVSDEEKKKRAAEATKRLEDAKKLSDALLAQQKQYEYDSAKSAAENAELKWQHEQEWAARQFEEKQNHERRLLEVQYQYNQITREQYEQGLQILDIQHETFYAQQEQKAVEHYAKVTEQVTKTLLDSQSKIQIQQVKDEYKGLYLSIENMVKAGKITSEEAAYYRVALKEREVEEIKRLEQQEADEQEKADAERAKKRAEQLSNDLKLAWKNAEQQYQIRKEYLQRELELYKDNAAKRAELEQQLAALESQHQQEKIDRLNEYTQQVGEVISNFADLTATVGENRIERYEEENEQEKQALDKRLKAGLISQEQYNSKVEDMDADLAAKKAAETRKQAALQKAVSAFEIVTNTAAAIMKIWAEVPKIDFGVSTMALTATAAAAGALQLGSVLAEPLPKARKGGLVKGASHEQGGVLLEVEGDERIVAAKPSRAFPELLNLISYIGKQQGQGSVNTYNELKGVIGAAEQGHDIVRTEKINEQVEQVLTYIRENGGVQQHREAFREIRELVQYIQTNTETTRKDITREQQRQTEQDILRTLQQNVVTESKHNETDIERQRVHDETTLRNITREQERRVQEEIIRSEQERIHTESSRSEQNIERQRDIERLQDIERQRTIDRIREEQQRSVEEDMKREQERVRTDSTFERIRNVVTQMYVEQAAQRGQGVPRAAAGGTLVEMEGNERIIAANPTRMFPELLNLISYIGKHAAIPQTGYSERQYAQMLRGAGSNDSVSIDIDYERLAALIGEQVVAGVRNTPIYLSLTELRDAQQQQAHIDQLTRQ